MSKNKLCGAALALALCALVSGSQAPDLRAADAAAEPGFKKIFNGKDLTGWKGDSQFWSVKSGILTGATTPKTQGPGQTYLVWSGGPVGDFEIRLRYRLQGDLDKEVNTGISYRGKEVGNGLINGYQADIASGDKWTGILVEMGGRHFLAMRGQKTVVDAAGKVNVVGSHGTPADLQKAVKTNDEWNDYEVVARGNHLIHKINGRIMAEVTDNQEDKRSMSGVLGLQLHKKAIDQVLQFKDIRIKVEAAPAAKKK